MVHYRDPGTITFEATIEQPEGPGAYVEFPFSAVDTFGVKARVPVHAVFDGSVTYTGSLAPYGGRHLLGVRKDIQKQLGKGPGDAVRVEVRLDNDRA
ncbi:MULTISPECIES: DUF1905 domain-containing protein [Mycobacteroides]|jgi:hypothetical protein|uniref:DUF1905 domain-containing protein n=1 Tax=Mycobacteroides chelonae TaxID=1774 RepID=A0AB73MSA4_MYCCH|nr:MULTISPECIES: DUF1905 domain-containing protein [Mycobacteroides]KRQ22147.1 hypothetical protein AOT86_20840 [Mycobacteroides sp. H072]KRQ30725.1 hypothetical protein AOT84_23570 [Mycobacteroides sp. H002]KRQ51426.1 hypothetical protein AOT85_11420 [Mycobacteroides sp. H054]KRQ69894.1 hypothetical protein AOT83_14005 [Mycobacteroides sp. H001]MBF9319043.1 DUF1905 domain-containing protein [Mycobacteroides chelonae]